MSSRAEKHKEQQVTPRVARLADTLINETIAAGYNLENAMQRRPQPHSINHVGTVAVDTQAEGGPSQKMTAVAAQAKLVQYPTQNHQMQVEAAYPDEAPSQPVAMQPSREPLESPSVSSQRAEASDLGQASQQSHVESARQRVDDAFTAFGGSRPLEFPREIFGFEKGANV